MSDHTGPGGPADELRRAFAAAESRAGRAMETLVAGKGFADLLAQAAENAAALSAINTQLCDLVLRNLRLAGRGDLHRLGHRLNGIEDKLEAVLQEVEDLGRGPAASEEAA
jgi:hypothetical protein